MAKTKTKTKRKTPKPKTVVHEVTSASYEERDNAKVERIAGSMDNIAAAIDRHTAEYSRYRSFVVDLLGAFQRPMGISDADLAKLRRAVAN
jgi:hypothetical protein